MLFTVVEDESQPIVESNSPFSSLANCFDSFILELFDEILLDPVLKDSSVGERRCILNWNLLVCINFAVWEEFFDLSVIIKERCPFLLVFKIEAHHHREIR